MPFGEASPVRGGGEVKVEFDGRGIARMHGAARRVSEAKAKEGGDTRRIDLDGARGRAPEDEGYLLSSVARQRGGMGGGKD